MFDTTLQQDNAAELVDGTSPGTHTTTIAMDNTWIARGAYKFFRGCSRGPDVQGPALPGFSIGWGEYEYGNDTTPCTGWLTQAAVSFQDGATAAFAAIPDYTVNRVVLGYDEVKNPFFCQVFAGDPGFGQCWRGGKGNPEDKPNGCVVVRVPSVDWRNGGVGHGMVPFLNDPRGPSVKQISPNEWDVTEPYQWQNFPATKPTLTLPGDKPVSAGFGFLLTGSADIVELAGKTVLPAVRWPRTST